MNKLFFYFVAAALAADTAASAPAAMPDLSENKGENLEELTMVISRQECYTK